MSDLVNIEKFLQDNDFVIPGFQRPYSWNVNEVSKLIDDIYKNFDINREFYLGALILYKNKNDLNNKSHLVIDGQNRIVTINLILRALKEFCKKHNIEQGDSVVTQLNKNIYKDESYSILRLTSNVLRYSKEGVNLAKILSPNEINIDNIEEYKESLHYDNYIKILDKIDFYIKNKSQLETFINFILNKIFIIPLIFNENANNTAKNNIRLSWSCNTLISYANNDNTSHVNIVDIVKYDMYLFAYDNYTYNNNKFNTNKQNDDANNDAGEEFLLNWDNLERQVEDFAKYVQYNKKFSQSRVSLFTEIMETALIDYYKKHNKQQVDKRDNNQQIELQAARYFNQLFASGYDYAPLLSFLSEHINTALHSK